MSKVIAALGTIASFAIILLAIGIGRSCGRAAGDAIMQPSKKEILDAAVAKINQGFPMMVNTETRLDSATASPDGQTLSYSYTLINWRADQMSVADISARKQHVINEICSKKDKTLLGKGFTLEFRYHSRDGVLVEDFRIGPNKCIYDPFAKGYGVAP